MREKRAKVRYLRARVEEAITERSIGSVQSKALSPSLSLSLSSLSARTLVTAFNQPYRNRLI